MGRLPWCYFAGYICYAQLYKAGSRWRLGSLYTSNWDNLLKFIISSIIIIKVSYREQITRNIRTADCISAYLTAASGGRGTTLGRRRASLGRQSLDGSNLALALGLLRGRVPVIDHLHGQNSVQSEASDEPVEDQLVVNLLESGEDARKGSGEVVENLYHCWYVRTEACCDRRELTVNALSCPVPPCWAMARI